MVSLSGASRSAFSRQNPGASFRWPNGRLLNSRCPCPSPEDVCPSQSSSLPILPPLALPLRFPVSIVSLSLARQPPPEAATCHPKRCLPPLHFCTGPMQIFTFALIEVPRSVQPSLLASGPLMLSRLRRQCLPCPRVNLSTGQLICLSLVHRASEPPGLSSCRDSAALPPLSPCHRAHLPPLAFHASSPLHFAHFRPLPLLRSRSPCQHVPNAFPLPRMHDDRNHLARHHLGMRDLRA